MRLKIILIILLILISGLLACSHTSAPKQYTLQFNYLCHSPMHKINKTLLVLPTRAAAQLHSEDMLYTTQKHHLAAFAKHQWIAPPAKLMTTLTAQAIQQSQHFRAVVTAPFSGIVDYRLSSRLVNLYQDFTRCPSHVVLDLEAELSDAHTGKLIAARAFRVDVIAPSNTPYGGVIAANQASMIVMQQLVIFFTGIV